MSLSATMQAETPPDAMIRISQTDPKAGDGAMPGGLTRVDIVFDGGAARIAGFDFLISYNPEELTILDVNEGSILIDNDWDFFSFRHGSSGLPQGNLRIIGLIDINDGSGDSPPRAIEPGSTFTTLVFFVGRDRTLNCSFLPIRWLWLDCRDNGLLAHANDTLLISDRVFDYAGSDTDAVDTEFRRELTGKDTSFPTTTGAILACDTAGIYQSSEASRRVVFYNGGVKVSCPVDVDDRGDLNLNGIAYEFADLEILLELFMTGADVTSSLTAADIVYFIRKVLDDAVERSELTHYRDTVTFKQSDGSVFSDLKLGGAFFEFEGNPDVRLLDPKMEILTGSNNGRKRVLIISLNNQQLKFGRILETEGKVLSAQASDFEGSEVAVKFDFATDVSIDEDSPLPEEYHLQQNYPNPFNPVTKIEFSISQFSEVELIVYNTLGRQVRSLASGVYSAGRYTVDWDGADDDGKQVTSGVYYYRLKAGDVVQSRKMVLLK